MKRILTLLLIIICCLTLSPTAMAEPSKIGPDFSKMFDQHGAVMLLIDSQTGSILYANNAAVTYYKYTKAQLESMNIDQINTLSSDEIQAEMQAASAEKRNYFVFKHRLANGSIRSVEVFSYPVIYNEKNVLFSIVHDITEKEQLEKLGKVMTSGIYIAGGSIIAFLLLLLILLFQSRKKIRLSKERFENLNVLMKTFIDADDSVIYLKDDFLNYVFVNKKFESFYKIKADQILGYDDYALSEKAFADLRRQTDLAVIRNEELVLDEMEWNSKIYSTTKFPVKMLNGRYGIGAYVKDITEERERIRRQEKELYRHKIIADVLSRGFKSKQEQLDYVLHEALKLTESQFGYIYLYDENTHEFTLNSWTKGVMESCEVLEKQTNYKLHKTGLWGEVVRQNKSIVVNDFAAENPLKKGYPTGHIAITKFMSVPVIMDEKIVAVVGLANKQSDYDDNDIYEMTLLMSGIWQAVVRREVEEHLSYERNKYLQTLISIGDGVMVVGQNQKIEMLNDVAVKLTGWPLELARGKHYKEVFQLSHEDSKQSIHDPIEGVFTTDSIHELGSHTVLTSKDGKKYYIEDSAAPIRDDTGKTVGVVLVFRDVSDKKEQQNKIEYLSFHDSLTGLYNRRFFEEELHRLDNRDNLPVSIIMGDVNGLKLTNDIFGHAFGDMLLQKVAKVLKEVCHAGDIIARWGGDEFVVLLPKTSLHDAGQMIARIKEKFSKEQINAFHGSISMGADTKQRQGEKIVNILDKAEEKMYAVKTLERVEFKSNAMNLILNSLHESDREKEHSMRVSNLCAGLGKALHLSEVDVRKLKEAGNLHDIGKIVLEANLRSKNHYQLTKEEQNEVKNHTVVGYRILNSFDETLDLAELILAHHEHWDGSGYPKGLSGEEIPLLARIIAIVESYDRMTHDSTNLKALSKEDAIQQIQDQIGTMFDPTITETFLELLRSEQEI